MRLLFLPLLACLVSGPLRAGSEPAARGTVVLLHGVALSGWAMQPLARALARDGYRVVNISYPSRDLPLEEIASRFLPAELARHGVGGGTDRLHFVTHSMGSLVLRAYLRQERPAHLGRVVMLGPPNHGSVSADHAMNNGVLRALVGCNLSRLGTGADFTSLGLGRADFEVGIIAGTAHLNPLFRGKLEGAHDGVVTVESAKLEGMKDFLVVPHSHTVMLWRAAVISQVRVFLREGRFRH